MFPILFILQRVSTFNINKMYFPELILFLKKKKSLRKAETVPLIANQSVVQERMQKRWENRHMYFRALLLSAPQVLL